MYNVSCPQAIPFVSKSVKPVISKINESKHHLIIRDYRTAPTPPHWARNSDLTFIKVEYSKIIVKVSIRKNSKGFNKYSDQLTPLANIFREITCWIEPMKILFTESLSL